MAASPTERSWCVLEFARSNRFVAVQRAFRRQFGRCGPPETSIWRWYGHFRYRGCICHQGKVARGRPSVTEETVLQNPPIIYTHPVPTKAFKLTLHKTTNLIHLADCMMAHITLHTKLEFLDCMSFTATKVCVTLKILKECTVCVISLRSVKWRY